MLSGPGSLITSRLKTSMWRAPARCSVSSLVAQRPFASLSKQPQNKIPTEWRRTLRRFTNSKWFSPEYVVYGIIGINCAVYLVWLYAQKNAKEFRDYKLLQFMYKNFMISWPSTVEQFRWWTIFTASFSHMEFMHLLVNMMTLYFFGIPVAAFLGSARFLSIYLLASAPTSLLTLIYQYYKASTEFSRSHVPVPVSSSLGASGNTMSAIVIFTCLNPLATIYLYFIPIPAYLATVGLILHDLWGHFSNQQSRTNFIAHLAGAGFGFVYYWRHIRKAIRR
ncbi:uncharacterized protein BJ171DRAFT_577977 [Polychytrium aggregatum]|uniref:uncharacterized protein n=1 Tax=Polychytrium aggregatum TaxID=110093 RepID=UPI0022FED6F0|nr:uncharacterized protein BJ171DRAFT_577977 [Polychytrium aggregatum]KAI9208161.1 hypothetical protein BJ171DRAFT_577977 [Polychytrium aggregatum]